ncbi:MAG: biotin/lipoyl-binding protein, partial [Thermoguttaceae bacterium]
EIRTRFQERFAPQKISLSELQQFVGMLHRNGLVVSSAPGQGQQLKRRHDERRRKERMAAVSNVLAIRFKGVDPERLLNWMHPYTAWFFSTPVVIACCMLGVSALSLIALQFDVFQSRLPAFQEFFGPENWLMLGLTLGVVKMMHEFGHGLSCKYFGGECHEIGIMLLVLTPCLYCNVSDSWMLPSKWRRAAIGAAGMYVELVLASIATFIWWFSDPGTLNHLALRVMFICSVSTVIFNGNPLLRYDGYYILSDIAEIPNLRQKASTILQRIMARWCLGLEQPDAPFLPKTNHLFFALFTVASNVYRWFVLLSILWFLNKVFEPYGLKILGQAIAAMSIGGLVLRPLWQLGKFFRVPGRMHQVKRLNVTITASVVVAIVAGILMVPIPRRVSCSFEIRPRDAESVYIDVPGARLEEVLVEPGQQVTAGTTLARLSNLDLRLSVAELTAQEVQYTERIRSLERSRFDDPLAGGEIPQAKKLLASVVEQLQKKQDQLSRLELIAKIDGTVMPAPERPDPPRPEGSLRDWSGSLMHPKNLGVSLTGSVLFCEIGDPEQLEAVLIVDQKDIELVKAMQSAEIKVEAYPHRTFPGQISEISKVNLKEVPRALSNTYGGDLATRTDDAGITRPLSTSYSASVLIDDPNGEMRLGFRGRARINTGYQPLGGRIWRYLSRTFHFWM